jgi:DNA-binding XRE family transcriptional regulator
MNATEFREMRERLGLSREALARALGLSVSQLADYESGWKRGTDRPALIPPIVDLAMMQLAVSKTEWRGTLKTFAPLTARLGRTLVGRRDVAQYTGVEVKLAVLFGARAGNDDLAWTAGTLRIEGLSADGSLRSIRISVDTTTVAEGSSLEVTLSDRTGAARTTKLSPEYPSSFFDFAADVPLQGPLDSLDLHLSVKPR